MNAVVTLAWYEHELAALCGIMRTAESLRRGFKRNTFCNNEDASDIDAAGAEMAVAKFLNRYWRAGVNTPDDADVGVAVEVRRTAHSAGRLIIRKPDFDERRYVLVRGTMPTFEIIGWMRGGEAKQDQWRANPNNDGEIFMVPEAALHKFKGGAK